MQVAGAFERRVIGDEDFAPPNGSIRAVASAVEGDAYDFAGKMIFGHAGSNVRVVMLYWDVLEVFAFESPFGREIIGMKIVGDDRGVHLKDMLETRDSFLKEIVAFEIFEVADVLTEKGLVVADDADGVL